MQANTLEQWIAESQWVVRATVETVGATTLGEAPVSDKTVTIRIAEILHGPHAFADHTGRLITLYSEQPRGLAKGVEAVFFTRSWLYGESAAVVEVGRLEEKDSSAMRKDIETAAQLIADRTLQERIGRAELVIAGKVAKTEPTAQTERRRVETEHDPDWWDADLEVESVEKGKTPERVVRILFANSRDELWIDSPKFTPGQRGIWILQRDQKEKGWPVLRVPGLTALDPLDFEPPDQLERIRRLIRR